MGMDPFNFAAAILCIMAQRLVRTLCPDCKKAYHPDQNEFDELVRTYGLEDFKKNVKVSYSDDLTLYKADGCDQCNNTGYRGRMAIHELLMGTDEIKRLIQTGARVEELRQSAMKDGMTTLKQDGIEKIFQGRTDLAQIRKVTIR
jgi:type II secretory ATPase GspE/PulE/Tfp pilus assembly ATPase PilB-like protein